MVPDARLERRITVDPIAGRTAARMRLARALAALLVAALGASCASFTRPEGDGGWSEARRQQEIASVASAAGVTRVGVAAGSDDTPDAAAAQAVQKGPMDLRTALDLAARQNRRIAEARKQLDAAEQRVFDVRGLLLPGTTANARYTWYTDSQTTSVNFPPGILPPGVPIPDVKVRDAEAGTVNATMLLPIDLSGELRHTLRAAQAGYRGEAARVWATTLEEQLAVVDAYFRVLEALRLREVTELTIAQYRAQLTIAQSRFDGGRLTKNDLLVVQVAVQAAEEELLRRALAIDRARWSFNQATGLEVNAPVDLVDVRTPPVVPDAEGALAVAYEENPIVRSLLEEQQRLDDTVTALVRSRLPRFNAGGAMDYNSSDILQPQEIGSGFVGFTWDVGTDTRREAQISEARIESEKNRIVMQRQLRDLESAVRLAQKAAEERLAAYATATAATVQATENLRIREQQFDVGRAQSDDVLIAQRLLTEQRATVATALYQAHMQRAVLQRLMGRPLEEMVE